VTHLALRLAHLGGGLRKRGIPTTLRDELDAAEAAMLVDVTDREDVHRALRIALKIPRFAWTSFDELFEGFWRGDIADEAPRTAPTPAKREVSLPPRREAPEVPRGGRRWDPEAREWAFGPDEDPEGQEPGFSREALLRRKPFDELDGSSGELAVMEQLLARLARRLTTHRSRRLVPTRGRGTADLRATYRKALRTSGELVKLARRARALEKPRLVFLCDTSGSMEAHGRFLLTFILSLRRAAPRTEVFAFNTELVWLTPLLTRGDVRLVLDRLSASVPDWSGGTRIGESLTSFVERHLQHCTDTRTIVVILSDGLDRGDPRLLAEATRLIHRRARKVVWLNPLLGDPRYEPEARGMRAALPFVDHFAAAHNVESLERLIPHLTR
jgi:uncharacterized protein with von Willebrand factor type A (vWA) domain